MTKDELDKLIKEKVAEQVGEKVGEKIDEKAKKLLDEQGDSYVKDQLKEQMDDAVKDTKAKMPAPDPKLEKAEEKAKGFDSFGEYLVSIRNYRMNRSNLDPRLTFVDKDGKVTKKAAKTTGHMEIGDDSQGGFLVPEIFKNDLYMIALENSVVRNNGATVIGMTTDSTKIPYVDDTDHSSNVFGGVKAYWTAEAAQKTASKPNFGQMELTPHKLAGITYTSNELLADSSIALEPLIKRMFGSAWGYYEDDAFIDGTGAGQPLGVLNCNSLNSIYRNTTNAVRLEDLSEMYAGMLPSSLSKAVWVVNPAVLPELIELGSGSSADASGKNLVWINNAADGPPMRILGRPVIVSEKLETLGTQGDILFADFRYYLIGDRQPITIDTSSHIRFDYDETAWRFVLRVAGQCWPASSLTTKDGSHTFSPFVVLNASTS